MRYFIPLLAMALGSLPWTTNAAGFGFKPYLVYDEAVTVRPYAVAIADVSGDGRADAILGSSFDEFSDALNCTLFIYAQKSNGSLAAPAIVHYHANKALCNLPHLETADLNHDGIQDIIVGRDKGISVLVARGQLKFDVWETDLPGDWQLSMASGDLNNDGHTDLAWHEVSGNLSILLGDGRGRLQLARTITGIIGGGLVPKIGEVTGDRWNDLVLAPTTTELFVLPGLGDGSFGQRQTYIAGNPSWFAHHPAPVITDVNFDGRNDVVKALPRNAPNNGHLIYLGGPNGGLTTPYMISMEEWWEGPEGTIAADLDHNGYPDFLSFHGGFSLLSFRLQGPDGLSSPKGVSIPYSSHFPYDAVASGDLNGDGCIDVAAAGYHIGLIVLHGQNCYEPPTTAVHREGDFDGDGRSDVLWHNAATGNSVIWRSGDATAQIPMARVGDVRWEISGIGDFNGDGKSDVLWRHNVTGSNSLWYSGDHQQSVALPRVSNLAWRIVGTGDFDHDGKSDILWREVYSGANVIWNQLTHGKGWNVRSVASAWKVVGVGDFDGNGTADILWRHVLSGQNAIWKNGDFQNQQPIDSVTDTQWQVSQLGDFDHDGSTDILWRHASNGRNVIWLKGNSARYQSIGSVTDLSWKISGVGDYNADGRADILWRNKRTGSNVIWRDANYRSIQSIAQVTNMSWSVAH